jgi:hypothetical protein
MPASAPIDCARASRQYVKYKIFDAKAQRRKENQQQEFLWLLQPLSDRAGTSFECTEVNTRLVFFASLRLCVEGFQQRSDARLAPT